jgi:hypothetical protein
MFKRLFFAMIGLGAGVALGVYAVRKVEATQKALRPDALAAKAAAGASGVRSRWATAVELGRDAAQEKEAELRAVYRATSAPQEH